MEISSSLMKISCSMVEIGGSSMEIGCSLRENGGFRGRLVVH